MTVASIVAFRIKLLDWFDRNRRNLPWRDNHDFYRIWVAEVMLQQTQVVKVLEYYNRFLQLFPDLPTLAAAELTAVLKAWEGLGYYARARNLHRAAQIIVNEFNGKIPLTDKVFDRLPGVGEYMAAAVKSQTENMPLAVVDGNVKRVLSRLFLIEMPGNSAAAKKRFRHEAEALLAPEAPGDFNQALMELGAVVCRPQNPICERCPVKTFCLAYSSNRQNELPLTSKKAKIPEFKIAVAVIRDRNKFLLVKRKPEGLLGGLWEFPGGKIQPDESEAKGCARVIKEKINLGLAQLQFVGTIKHAYTHFKIRAAVFTCQKFFGQIRLSEHEAFRWLTGEQFDSLPMHKANLKIISLLKEQQIERRTG